MKDKLAHTLAFTLATGGTYFVCSFIAWDFDISMWSRWERFVLIILLIIEVSAFSKK